MKVVLDLLGVLGFIYDLEITKFKTVPVDLKKLSNVVDNGVVKNIKFSTLKLKVNS